MSNKNENNIEIVATENYGDLCLKDNGIDPNNRKPQGFVEIYETDNESKKKKLIGKHNLVVYLGREHLAQRLLNYQNSNIDPDKDCFLAWMGYGNGGVDESDPLNPLPTSSTETDLSNEIPVISSADSTSVGYGDLRVGYYYKKRFESIEFEQDSANNNSWLIIKLTSLMTSDECNGYQISEAALFNAASRADGYSPGANGFHLYAKLKFPPISKIASISRTLTFTWYIYM
jgi:hypothetical protein